jgi:hypothetical protein
VVPILSLKKESRGKHEREVGGKTRKIGDSWLKIYCKESYFLETT